MAERPIFLPSNTHNSLVEEKVVAFLWHKGMHPSQKKKNVKELHTAAAEKGLSPLLEISTKSDEELGRSLSAFNLSIELSSGIHIPLECAYQASKVFERGGPYTDLLSVTAREAKQDARLKNSGQLIDFCFEGRKFPPVPMTAFYDWLYIKAIYPRRDELQVLSRYKGFTDIEFNPKTAVNCQARSCATFVSLERLGLLEQCVDSQDRFWELLIPNFPKPITPCKSGQDSLF